jgi:acyl-CoA thioester hydrolase
MWNRDKTVLKSVMWSRLVHYNLQGLKSQAHSAELMEFFQQVVAPLPEQWSFDDRVKEIKSNLKSIA